MAAALARQGGIGIIHRNLSISRQSAEVDKVKRSESGMIVDPITMRPRDRIRAVFAAMEKYDISGVPITDETGKLVGILTNRDLRFESNMELEVSEIMTSEGLVTVKEGITLEEAKRKLHEHRIEKLLVVDDDFRLKGLITVKDIMKAIAYPNACKDDLGRLRVGAAVGTTGDFSGACSGARKSRGRCDHRGHGTRTHLPGDPGSGRVKEATFKIRSDCRQHCLWRSGTGTARERRRRRQGGDGAGEHLYNQGDQRSRSSTDYSHPGNSRGRRQAGTSRHRRRRNQVLGRHRKSSGCRRGHSHDR